MAQKIARLIPSRSGHSARWQMCHLTLRGTSQALLVRGRSAAFIRFTPLIAISDLLRNVYRSTEILVCDLHRYCSALATLSRQWLVRTPQVSRAAGNEVLLRHAQGLSREEIRQLVMMDREKAWHSLPFLFDEPLCNPGHQTAARHGPPAAMRAGCSKPVRHARSDAGADVGRPTAGPVVGLAGTACPSNQ
jgi:hypothetical protein